MIAKKMASLFRRTLTRLSPVLNTIVCYRVKFGRKLDLDNPRTLNEKILWLKLNEYNSSPLVKRCADKLAVRSFVEGKGLSRILNPLLSVYDSPSEIDWENLPSQFALKMNVGCGCNLIVPNKAAIDKELALRTIRSWMGRKQWLDYAELQYKDVKEKILLEKYLGGPDGALPTDYKFYCFNGKPLFVMLCVDRGADNHPKYFFYNREWELQPITRDALANPDYYVEKPDGIDEAFDCAALLSEDFPFVRCDLYLVDKRVVFGEMTFTPSGGMDTGRLSSTDEFFGSLLELPELVR